MKVPTKDDDILIVVHSRPETEYDIIRASLSNAVRTASVADAVDCITMTNHRPASATVTPNELVGKREKAECYDA